MSATPVRVLLVVILAMVLQAAVVAELRVAGAAGDLLLLVAVAAGLSEGPERGAVVGFAAGCAMDLMLTTPFGLSALAYCLAGWAVGHVAAGALRPVWWLTPLAAAVGSTLGILGYALAAATVGLGHLLDSRLLAIVLVVAGFNALLAPLAVRAATWAGGGADRALAR